MCQNVTEMLLVIHGEEHTDYEQVLQTIRIIVPSLVLYGETFLKVVECLSGRHLDHVMLDHKRITE